MIGSYVECEGCGFRIIGQAEHPDNWTTISDSDGTQHFCARTCALATVGRGHVLRRYPAGVTPVEVEILELVASGKSNKEIGIHLHRAESTVKNQLSAVFVKLGVEDRSQSLLAAQALGILNVVQLAERFYRNRPDSHWSRTRPEAA